MAAESPKRSVKYNHTVIRPHVFSDKTVMESVVDFISDVVPQAYSSNQKIEDKEKIQWVRFENTDGNDLANNPDFSLAENKGIPLLLILGYSNGVQIWNITPSGEAQEALSLRQGPVKVFRILPTPTPVFSDYDPYSVKRPLAAVCDATSAGQPYCSVKFVSLRTGDEVHNVSFKNIPVHDIECNKRVMVVVFQEKLCIFDAYSLKQLFWVTSCFPSHGPNVNPIALGTKWLAYADKRLVPVHQSCGGMSGDGSQSYAATVISAAKGAFKGLTMFGEAIVSNVTGNKPAPPTKKVETVIDNGNRPGIVSIIDMQAVMGEHFCVSEENEGEGLIAHFHAHANEPVAAMSFDVTGTLLLTACKLGHNFHVFRVMAHPCSSSLGAIHHLYTLHRGDTTAKVIDMSFSQDSRWVTVNTHRGTTHVFPITPYGGTVNLRTHCSPRVVNRASRYHKSAGLDESEYATSARRSPVLSGSPGSSAAQYDNYPSLIRHNAINNSMGNPRLPPFPHPTTLYPLAQIKQPLNLVTSIGGKSQSPSHNATGTDNVISVSSCFCTPRLWVGGSPNLSVDKREEKRAVDSLFVMSQFGTLVEYILEPKPKTATSEKINDESLLDLSVTGYTQWHLQRSKISEEVKPPLANNNPLMLAADAVRTQQPTCLQDLGELAPVTRHDSKDSLSSDHSYKDTDFDEQWLSQVEIFTHVRPHRRLWMGPQFSFKTYQNVQNTTVLSSNSSALLSNSPEANVAAMDIVSDECDLESLKIQPARSSPVAMPNSRPAYRRQAMGSDSTPPPLGKGPHTPLLIEAGSFDQSPNLCDVYTSWAESTVAKQPRGSEEEEDRIKETLAEAMLESPLKEGGPSSIRNGAKNKNVKEFRKSKNERRVGEIAEKCSSPSVYDSSPHETPKKSSPCEAPKESKNVCKSEKCVSEVDTIKCSSPISVKQSDCELVNKGQIKSDVKSQKNNSDTAKSSTLSGKKGKNKGRKDVPVKTSVKEKDKEPKLEVTNEKCFRDVEMTDKNTDSEVAVEKMVKIVDKETFTCSFSADCHSEKGELQKLDNINKSKDILHDNSFPDCKQKGPVAEKDIDVDQLKAVSVKEKSAEPEKKQKESIPQSKSRSGNKTKNNVEKNTKEELVNKESTPQNSQKKSSVETKLMSQNPNSEQNKPGFEAEASLESASSKQENLRTKTELTPQNSYSEQNKANARKKHKIATTEDGELQVEDLGSNSRSKEIQLGSSGKLLLGHDSKEKVSNKPKGDQVQNKVEDSENKEQNGEVKSKTGSKLANLTAKSKSESETFDDVNLSTDVPRVVPEGKKSKLPSKPDTYLDENTAAISKSGKKPTVESSESTTVPLVVEKCENNPMVTSITAVKNQSKKNKKKSSNRNQSKETSPTDDFQGQDIDFSVKTQSKVKNQSHDENEVVKKLGQEGEKEIQRQDQNEEDGFKLQEHAQICSKTRSVVEKEIEEILVETNVSEDGAEYYEIKEASKIVDIAGDANANSRQNGSPKSLTKAEQLKAAPATVLGNDAADTWSTNKKTGKKDKKKKHSAKNMTFKSADSKNETSQPNLKDEKTEKALVSVRCLTVEDSDNNNLSCHKNVAKDVKGQGIDKNCTKNNEQVYQKGIDQKEDEQELLQTKDDGQEKDDTDSSIYEDAESGDLDVTMATNVNKTETVEEKLTGTNMETGKANENAIELNVGIDIKKYNGTGKQEERDAVAVKDEILTGGSSTIGTVDGIREKQQCPHDSDSDRVNKSKIESSISEGNKKKDIKLDAIKNFSSEDQKKVDLGKVTKDQDIKCESEWVSSKKSGKKGKKKAAKQAANVQDNEKGKVYSGSSDVPECPEASETLDMKSQLKGTETPINVKTASKMSFLVEDKTDIRDKDDVPAKSKPSEIVQQPKEVGYEIKPATKLDAFVHKNINQSDNVKKPANRKGKNMSETFENFGIRHYKGDENVSTEVENTDFGNISTEVENTKYVDYSSVNVMSKKEGNEKSLGISDEKTKRGAVGCEQKANRQLVKDDSSGKTGDTLKLGHSIKTEIPKNTWNIPNSSKEYKSDTVKGAWKLDQHSSGNSSRKFLPFKESATIEKDATNTNEFPSLTQNSRKNNISEDFPCLMQNTNRNNTSEFPSLTQRVSEVAQEKSAWGPLPTQRRKVKDSKESKCSFLLPGCSAEEENVSEGDKIEGNTSSNVWTQKPRTLPNEQSHVTMKTDDGRVKQEAEPCKKINNKAENENVANIDPENITKNDINQTQASKLSSSKGKKNGKKGKQRIGSPVKAEKDFEHGNSKESSPCSSKETDVLEDRIKDAGNTLKEKEESETKATENNDDQHSFTGSKGLGSCTDQSTNKNDKLENSIKPTEDCNERKIKSCPNDPVPSSSKSQSEHNITSGPIIQRTDSSDSGSSESIRESSVESTGASSEDIEPVGAASGDIEPLDKIASSCNQASKTMAESQIVNSANGNGKQTKKKKKNKKGKW